MSIQKQTNLTLGFILAQQTWRGVVILSMSSGLFTLECLLVDLEFSAFTTLHSKLLLLDEALARLCLRGFIDFRIYIPNPFFM